MEKLSWTNTDVRKLFRMELRYKSVQTLYNAEERGEIPKAERKARGKVNTRLWSLAQLPIIGEKYGFLNKPKNQIINCTFQQKGGVTKTTTTYNKARILALNGLKVLIIPLDPECSLTDILAPQKELARLDDMEEIKGLYHFFCQNIPLENLIKNTSIPTLDFIPETHDLVKLNRWMGDEKRREYLFQAKLIPYLNNYDVILFDNGPTWNFLVENSLMVSSSVSMPMACNLLAYNASATNMQNIYDFQDIMQIESQEIIMFSTLLERSSLSQQINATYLSRYPENMITTPIRKSVKWEEALMAKQTILEYAPDSEQANDYFHLICDEWYRMNFRHRDSVEVDIENTLEVV